MDLSFQRFERDRSVSLLPSDLAVLLVGVAARQAASPTATWLARRLTGGTAAGLLAPADGAFNGAVAALVRGWQGR